MRELFVVPTAGGDWMKLNDPIVAGGAVTEFQISSDSRHVVYRADQHEVDLFELFSVSLAGDDVTKLNDPLVLRGDVLPDFQLSEDSQWVVYRADQEIDGVTELYSVSIAGGGSVKLSTPSNRFRAVHAVRISPDSMHVVFLADQYFAFVKELYSVPIEGGSPIKLNGPLVRGGHVFDLPGQPLGFQISADGQRVVYLADQDSVQDLELYSVEIDGTSHVKLNGPLIDGGDVEPDFRISPDSSRVVFRADQAANDAFDLMSVSIAGGTPTTLNPPLVSEGDVLTGFAISQDSGHVVYRADQTADDVFELYSVPIDGGDALTLSNALPPGSTVLADFEITEDGRDVVYLADQETTQLFELYKTPLTGGDSVKLSDPLIHGGDVRAGFQLSSDANAVVFRAGDFIRPIGLYAGTLDDGEGLTATRIVTGSSGFSVEFNAELNENQLNLYDARNGQLGPTDVVLSGAEVGEVAGSLIVDASLDAATFIKSGPPLAADTYTLRLRSGTDAFQLEDGRFLDGNGDGIAGDDLVHTFTVEPVAEEARIVGTIDFVRGPGQTINLPADTMNGIPISLSDGAGVRSIRLVIEFDSNLLTVTGATVGDGVPAGTEVDIDTATAGRVTLSFTSPSGLPAGPIDFVRLQASVPNRSGAEIYRQQNLVRVNEVEVLDSEGGELPAIGDDALHLVEYFGDVSGNGAITASDAAQVARVAAGLDHGFLATPRSDPRIVSDISGNGRVNALDAALLAQFAAQLDVPEIPSIPADFAAFTGLTEGRRTIETGRDRAADDVSELGRIAVWAHWGDRLLPYAAVDQTMAEIEDLAASDQKEQPQTPPLEEAVAELLSS